MTSSDGPLVSKPLCSLVQVTMIPYERLADDNVIRVVDDGRELLSVPFRSLPLGESVSRMVLEISKPSIGFTRGLEANLNQKTRLRSLRSACQLQTRGSTRPGRDRRKIRAMRWVVAKALRTPTSPFSASSSSRVYPNSFRSCVLTKTICPSRFDDDRIRRCFRSSGTFLPPQAASWRRSGSPRFAGGRSHQVTPATRFSRPASSS